MLNRVIQWMLGYTLLSFSGDEACRYINLLAAAHIPFCALRREGENYSLKIRCFFAESASKLSGRCDIKLSFSEQRGFPVYIHSLIKRPGLLAGAVFGLLLCLTMSGRVWIIECENSSFYSEAEILSAAKDCGLDIGKGYEGDASLRLLKRLPKLDWCSINRDGVFARIALRDKTEKPEIEDKKRVCNIIAAEGGRVISARAEKGKLLAKVGSGVKKGEMLISGVWKNEKGELFTSLSRGTIMAETRHSIIAYVSKNSRIYAEGEETVKRELSFFGLRFPLTLNPVEEGKYEFSEHDESLILCGVKLPIFIRTQHFSELKESNLTISDEEARIRALHEAEDNLKEYLGENGELILKNEEIYETDNFVYIKWDCLCMVNIAKEQTVFVT